MIRSLSIAAVCLLLALLAAPAAAEEKAAAAIVELDVVFLELASEGAEADAGPTDLGADPLSAALALAKEGKASSLTRMRITTIDGGSASISFGAQVPLVTGRTAFGRNAGGGGFGGGQVANSYSMQNVGTLLKVAPSVAADGSVLLKIEFERSDIAERAAKASDKPREGEEGAISLPESFEPPSIERTQTETTTAVPAGKSTIVSGLNGLESNGHTGAKSGSQSYLIVGAKVTAAPPAENQAQAAESGADELRVFRLQNAAAAETAKLLSMLNFDDAQFAADERTNSIIAKGASERLHIAEALLMRLDEQSGAASADQSSSQRPSQ